MLRHFSPDGAKRSCGEGQACPSASELGAKRRLTTIMKSSTARQSKRSNIVATSRRASVSSAPTEVREASAATASQRSWDKARSMALAICDSPKVSRDSCEIFHHVPITQFVLTKTDGDASCDASSNANYGPVLRSLYVFVRSLMMLGAKSCKTTTIRRTSIHLSAMMSTPPQTENSLSLSVIIT